MAGKGQRLFREVTGTLHKTTGIPRSNCLPFPSFRDPRRGPCGGPAQQSRGPGDSREPPGPKRGWELATLSFPCAGRLAQPPVGGQGSDTGVTCDPRLNRFSPGRPRLLALRWPGVDGSDLLSLRLPSVDLPAVRFVASPDLTEGFPPCLAGPPRCKRPLCHIFRCGLGSVLN